MVLLQALNDTIEVVAKLDKVCEQGHSLIHWLLSSFRILIQYACHHRQHLYIQFPFKIIENLF